MIKILICSSAYPAMGGISTWTEELKFAFKNDADYKLIFFSTNLSGRKSVNYSQVFRLVNGFLFGLFLFFRYAFFFVRYRPSCVHLCSSGGYAHLRDILFSIFAKLFRCKVILHLHFGAADLSYKWVVLGRNILKFASALADCVIVFDERMKSLTASRNFVVLSNYLRARECSVNIQKENIVLFAGWIIEEKGVFDLICSWKSIDTSGWRLCIAGPGSHDNINRLQRCFSGNNIDYIGAVSNDELIEVMNRSKIFVLPSRSEGFPYVLIEAMRSRCCILATAVGGVPSMFSSAFAKPGILLNDVSELSLGLEKLLLDERLVDYYSKGAFSRYSDSYTERNCEYDLKKVWGGL